MRPGLWREEGAFGGTEFVGRVFPTRVSIRGLDKVGGGKAREWGGCWSWGEGGGGEIDRHTSHLISRIMRFARAPPHPPQGQRRRRGEEGEAGKGLFMQGPRSGLGTGNRLGSGLGS